jgi:hypothetical protein
VHEFVRLLVRLKTNYSIRQLSAVPCYKEWIHSIATFTVNTFTKLRTSFDGAINSLIYLFNFWARLVHSRTFISPSSQPPTYLETIIPEVRNNEISRFSYKRRIADFTRSKLISVPFLRIYTQVMRSILITRY